MIAIKHVEMNEISTLIYPLGADVPLNKQT